MHCPMCHMPLNAIEAAGIELDQCESCHGIWFDKNELLPFIDFIMKSQTDIGFADYQTDTLRYSVPGGDEPIFSCPVCDSEMTKFNYAVDSDVILDRCPECGGLWVETPEIRELARFLEGEPALDRLYAARTGMAADSAALIDTVDGLVMIARALATNLPPSPWL